MLRRFKVILSATLAITSVTALAQNQNYGEALQKSIYFYESQQSGNIPAWNRVPWRAEATPTDGQDVGLDLRGGWFDAGDHVKFGFPMASTTTLLAWSVVDYRDAYAGSGQLQHMLNNLRYVNDYFINAHPSPNEFYGQVGLGNADHTFWGPPEVVHHKIPDSRVSMKIDLSCPGVDLASETAAAMAASSMAFAATDGAYSSTLLSHARDLFDFAEATLGEDGVDNNYSNCITDAQGFYNADYGVYWDEFTWAAVWMWRATGEQRYLDTALAYYDKMGFETQSTTPVFAWSQSWNDKAYGVYTLLAALLGDEKYHADIQRHLDHWSIGGGTRTPGGIIVVDSSGWGVNRYAANTAFLALYYADALGPNDPLYDRYHNFGKHQIDYILGDNPANLSFLIGYGDDYPTNVHHRGSHGSWADSLSVPTEQRHILYGAVVAGPSNDTDYEEDRGDYIQNEVATDYNSGFTGAAAILFDHYGGAPLPDSQFPPAEPPKDDEYLLGAKVNSSGARHIEISAVIQNRSTTPAKAHDDLYFRYFYDLTEVFDAGYSLSDIDVGSGYSQASSISDLTPWGDPADNIYYVEVRFDDIWIYPGGQSEHRREVQFRVSLPTTSGLPEWDNSNDPSWDPAYATTSEQYGMVAPKIPVYDSTGLLFGEEPGPGCGSSTGINCLPTANDLNVVTDYESSVAVSLEANDSDGSIEAYEIVSAPANGSLTGSGSQRSYEPDAGFFGSDSFTYRAIDDAGASSNVATVSITVNEPMIPALAITSPANGSSVEVSSDFTVSYSLSYADSARAYLDELFVAESDTGSMVLTAPASEGSFTVRLVALDAQGDELEASDTLSLTAIPEQPNTAPVACIDAVGSVYVGSSVGFSSCSTDADGDALTLSWDFGDGNSASGANVSHAFSAAGSYVVTLTADDGEDSDTVTLTVMVEEGGLNCDVDYDVTNAWDGAHQVNITVTNTGSETINGYSLTWPLPAGECLTDNGWNANFEPSCSTATVTQAPDTWNGRVAPGQTSSFGAIISRSQAQPQIPSSFSVNGQTCTGGGGGQDNRPPLASFTASTDLLTLSANAGGSSDPDGDSLTYTWDFGDGSTGTGVNVTHTYDMDGDYIVTLSVSDGEFSDDASQSVSVSAGQDNQAPEAAFSVSTDGLSIVVDGSASVDPDGDSLSYVWDFGDGSASSGPQASHTYADAGSYSVSLTVSDGELDDVAFRDVTVTEGFEPGGACEFVIENQWGSGFVGYVRVHNNGDSSINGWEISFTLPTGSSVTNYWNATLDGNNPYTATPLGWNSQIAPGSYAEFGVQATASGPVTPPEVSGAVCGTP